jgi:hypothetical protein
MKASARLAQNAKQHRSISTAANVLQARQHEIEETNTEHIQTDVTVSLSSPFFTQIRVIIGLTVHVTVI